MTPHEKRKAGRADFILPALLIAGGLALSGISLMQLASRGEIHLAQATQPPTTTQKCAGPMAPASAAPESAIPAGGTALSDQACHAEILFQGKTHMHAGRPWLKLSLQRSQMDHTETATWGAIQTTRRFPVPPSGHARQMDRYRRWRPWQIRLRAPLTP